MDDRAGDLFGGHALAHRLFANHTVGLAVSASHLPGYIDNAAKLRAAGFDAIACVSVNDPFVMDAWGKATGADDKVMMLADADGAFTKAIGLVVDLPAFGLSGRSERYSMVVEDGVVTRLDVEKSVLDHDGSSAACMLRN